MLVTIIILSILLLLSLYGIYNLNKKVMQYEDYTLEIREIVELTIQTMRNIDSSGAFESEDEVGSVFTGLLEAVNQLDKFMNDGTYEGEKIEIF